MMKKSVIAPVILLAVYILFEFVYIINNMNAFFENPAHQEVLVYVFIFGMVLLRLLKIAAVVFIIVTLAAKMSRQVFSVAVTLYAAAAVLFSLASSLYSYAVIRQSIDIETIVLLLVSAFVNLAVLGLFYCAVSLTSFGKIKKPVLLYIAAGIYASFSIFGTANTVVQIIRQSAYVDYTRFLAESLFNNIGACAAELAVAAALVIAVVYYMKAGEKIKEEPEQKTVSAVE